MLIRLRRLYITFSRIFPILASRRLAIRLVRLHTTLTWPFQEFKTTLRIIEFAAILIAIFAFFMELTYRHEEREARAWQLLIAKAPGNSGKIEALEYLHKRGASLRGIDLAPPEAPKVWDEWDKKLKKRDGKLELPLLPLPNCPQGTY